VKLRTLTAPRPFKDPHRHRRLVVTLTVILAMISGLLVSAQIAHAGTSDLVFTVSASDFGLDPSVMAEVVPEFQSEITAAGGLGQAIEQETAEYPVIGTTVDTSAFAYVNGTLALSPDGSSLVITIPGAEVQANASPWASFGAWVAGGILGYAARMLCIGGLIASGVGAATYPLVCTPLGGAVAGFFQGIIVHAIDKDLKTPKAWADILLKTLGGAIAGGVWEKYFSPWAKANLAGYFKKAGTWLINNVPWLNARFGSAAGTAAEETGTMMEELNRALEEAMADWAPATAAQVIADPAYIDPTSDPTDWNTLIGSPTSKLGVVVANVLNGPGSTAVAGWTDAIDRAHASGKKVLGYVDTGYLGLTGRTTRLGSTATADWVAQIEQDINAWYSLYGSSVDGIFFDDGYNVCGTDDEYAAVYDIVNQYEKLNHPGAMTVLNPGTAVPQCYEGTADVLLTFEGSDATYESSAYQALDWTPASPSEIWHIIYGVTASDVSLVDETSQTRGAGYVYITDDVPANPYDTIPSFWSAEEADVPGGTPYVADAVDYTTGPPVPTAPSGLAVTSSDYTSAALTWTAGADVADYLVYLNGQEVASLPPDETAATIGGLTPGGTAYTLDVVAQGYGGDLSAASNSVSVTTLSLPGGQAITNYQVTAGSGTVTYSADFLVPYSFRRVYISPPLDSSESCWWMADNDPAIGGPFCAHWLIENTTLLVYAGSGSDWTWTPIAYVPPTISGSTYSWTVNSADIGDATNFVGFEGQGYGPLTDVYTPGCSPLAGLICILP